MAIISNILKRSILFIFPMAIIPAAFYFEQQIKSLYPDYSAKLLLSGIVFLFGLAYFYATRNGAVLIFITLATIAMPWLIKWIFFYWP